MTPAGLRDLLAAEGCLPLLERLDGTGGGSTWFLRTEAATVDAAYILRQALTLHRKAGALHKELLSAETALANDDCEANMARMRDIQDQLAALTGTEAAVEGFGASSGRSGFSI